ncbi:hypothetical protein SteCoe_3670 [Stentor coeruleus]|uniref:Uncharacterized protein n=1 Tax=Stentor coeruleus TaxID=5963 RepID=A0A1R2CWC6_9CILI|nr:hypothetical protein SteCoe_3670 [Stentor coeruleus]
MDSNTEKRREYATKLLEELLTNHLEETQNICNELNMKLEDLSQTSPDSFIGKGVTSDIKHVRFNHFEERRIAKIFKIASEVSKILESNFEKPSQNLKSILSNALKAKSCRGSSAHSARSENHSLFTRPQDMISHGLQKEKEKFNRSVKTLERISFLREEAKSQAEAKRKHFEIQNKVIMHNRYKKSQEFQKTVMVNVEHRKKILEKKYQNMKDIDKVMLEYGAGLEKRMMKLEEWQKVEIRKQLKEKRAKLKQRLVDERRKFEMEQEKTRSESILAGELIENITRKIDRRVMEYINNISSRVQTAKGHSVKVNNTLKTCLKIEGLNYSDSLRKSVNKSLLSSKKVAKKYLIASESSEKMKKLMNESFQKHNRIISEVSSEEMRRLEKITVRSREKEKLCDRIQKDINRKYEEKKQQNYTRMERHFQAYIEKQRDEILRKKKVLEKHKRLSSVADELSIYKMEVATNKRRSNLEIQRIRSSRGSAGRYSFITPRKFDKTF